MSRQCRVAAARRSRRWHCCWRGCSSSDHLAHQAHRLQVRRRRTPSLELPPDLTTPTLRRPLPGHTRRRASRPPNANKSGRGDLLPDRCRTPRSSAPAANAGWWSRPRRSSRGTRSARSGRRTASRSPVDQPTSRRHGNRLGRKPRRGAAGLPAAHARQRGATSSAARTSATSSARASSAAPNPAPWRSSSPARRDGAGADHHHRPRRRGLSCGR